MLRHGHAIPLTEAQIQRAVYSRYDDKSLRRPTDGPAEVIVKLLTQHCTTLIEKDDAAVDDLVLGKGPTENA